MRRPSEHLLAVGVLLSGLLWSRSLSSEQPCDKGTFREAPGQKCVPCDLCDGDHREYQRPCSATANALCRCRPGFECGGPACQRCPCPAGQMWTPQGCQNCPEGKFNNGTLDQCHPWTQCPEGIRTPGTEKTDVVCQPGPEAPFTTAAASPGVVSTKMHPTETDPGLLAFTAALVGALLLFLALLFLPCIFFRSSWAQAKFQKGPRRQPAQEVDDCTYGYPEEEEGGGSDGPFLKGELLPEKAP
ncbi:hypothetical protein JRQ81_009860 [Phrynocephalus forsythii]|uniref:TNFR-Cys domain-containing protein n=1 Tax=Phrynocephalus forsythii TaxID=171643 RepID=A0A9Q1ARI8_9SAUR|nr:hypothetical protein JRQ81_009860 [Phrynocephalus forsythii]